MTSLPTSIQSLTSQPLTPDQREDLAHQLAFRWLEGMSTRDLERVFLEQQIEYLDSYSDEDLLSEVEDNFHDDEFAEILKGLSEDRI
jgi:hypothetical protein